MKPYFSGLVVGLAAAILTGCGNKELSAQINRLDGSQVDFSDISHTFNPVTKATTLQMTAWQPAPRVGFSVTPQEADVRQVVKDMVGYVNQLRRDQGLPEVAYDPSLAAYAQQRATDLVPRFGQQPDGRAGLRGHVAENAAVDGSAEDIKKHWLNNVHYHGNILRPSHRKVGIGLERRPRGGLQWVLVLADDKAQSDYYFDTRPVPPRIKPDSKINVTLLEKMYIAPDGQVSQDQNDLPFVENNAAQAFQTGALSHGIFKAAKRYQGEHYQATIQDAAGVFAYQTLGEITDHNGVPRQFVTLGKPTAPSENVAFSATYRGASLGALSQKSHVYADVVADVTFGDQKQMDVRFTNSQLAKDDIQANHPQQPLSPAPHLDFSERLQWRDQHFQGATTRAAFYGTDGQEMGGQFSRTVSGERYDGVFGLKK